MPGCFVIFHGSLAIQEAGMKKSIQIVDQPVKWLVGFNFFGDPFQSRAGWDAENEIGRLWQRFSRFCAEQPDLLPKGSLPGIGYEVHIHHLETIERGEFEVFTGYEIDIGLSIPIQMVLKFLPAVRYAVFTLSGEEITSDWDAQIEAWLKDNSWVSDYGFNYQRYDHRFRGMDHLEDSEVEVWVPLRPAGK
jgi:predicted transcriptional regulator YdeE